jgi:hypothetical protein
MIRETVFVLGIWFAAWLEDRFARRASERKRIKSKLPRRVG